MCSGQVKQDAAVLAKSFLVLSAPQGLSPVVMNKAKAELLWNYYVFGDRWRHVLLKNIYILCRAAILCTKWRVSARAKSIKCIKARGWGLGNQISMTRQGRGWLVQGSHWVSNKEWSLQEENNSSVFIQVALKIKDISTHPSATGKAKVKALSPEDDSERHRIIHVPLAT